MENMIIPELNVEFGVVRKTNNYVYFTNGGKLNWSQFHHYKQNVRKFYNENYGELKGLRRNARTNEIETELLLILNLIKNA
jgi:hypothetical protein